jgi:hypothetical protein
MEVKFKWALVLLSSALFLRFGYMKHCQHQEQRELAPYYDIAEVPGNFMVIAGNFESVENATPSVLRLRSLGYKYACAMKYGERYRVVVSRHETIEEAHTVEAELEQLSIDSFTTTVKQL